ncbi:metallophosphoesterase [Clostridium sp. D2Q-14]|uniref:metallophosphoesterase n=1 Tax=Anaeromonas gelatinilytica TaxID=2683194 RepID=UPI00193BFA32|nr:metallophosphoesterase [Anaeromonas gelatinilytica]MBS4535348.1 metallophosphoesterase [Anaeromonas gelatinilytica]
MKIGIISDTHGNIDKSIEVLNSIEDIDLFIHLGDYTQDAEKIQKETNIYMINVKGNCDINEDNVSEEEIIEIKGKKILITHGHDYRVKWGLNKLYYRGRELKVDIIIFGHIHQPVNIIEDGILIFNPGSISSPRSGSKKSYGIISIDDDIKSEIIEI